MPLKLGSQSLILSDTCASCGSNASKCSKIKYVNAQWYLSGSKCRFCTEVQICIYPKIMEYTPGVCYYIDYVMVAIF